MKIIIIGAGEVGQFMADRLCANNHEVTVIDTSKASFEQLHEHLDVMTIGGDATNVEILKQAGIKKSDMLIAVSGDQNVNVIACQIAHFFGVKKTICRMFSPGLFSEEDGLTAQMYAIDSAFSSTDACVEQMFDSLQRRNVLERIHFSNPLATVVMYRVTDDSTLQGLKLHEVPQIDLVRIAAVVRKHKILTPHGNTTICEGDRLYISGRYDHVESFLDNISRSSKKEQNSDKLIVIAGGTLVAEKLGRKCLESGMRVRFIIENLEESERFLSCFSSDVTVINGSANDADVLEEAGVEQCDAFAAALDTDESNILACVIARNSGTRKVVALTSKPEYICIVPAIDAIDGGCNTTLASVNAIFRMMDLGIVRVDSRLQIFQSFFSEFRIDEKSQLAGKMVREIVWPEEVILSMIFRDEDVIAPSGNTMLQPGDVVVAILNQKSEEQLKKIIR